MKNSPTIIPSRFVRTRVAVEADVDGRPNVAPGVLGVVVEIKSHDELCVDFGAPWGVVRCNTTEIAFAIDELRAAMARLTRRARGEAWDAGLSSMSLPYLDAAAIEQGYDSFRGFERKLRSTRERMIRVMTDLYERAIVLTGQAT